MKRIDCKDFESICCIYKITNDVNDLMYVGSTRDLKSRVTQHLYDFNNRKNYTAKLYEAMTKIGIEHFYIDIVEVLDSNIETYDLHNIESEYIIKFNTLNNGYNQRLDIDGKLIVSEETRKKCGERRKINWEKGFHKDHARKLSKFKYNIYDLNNNLLDEDILIKDITAKYNIASSNIFQTIQKNVIKEFGHYDDKKTYRIILKGVIIERSFNQVTTREKTKIKQINNMKVTLNF